VLSALFLKLAPLQNLGNMTGFIGCQGHVGKLIKSQGNIMEKILIGKTIYC